MQEGVRFQIRSPWLWGSEVSSGPVVSLINTASLQNISIHGTPATFLPCSLGVTAASFTIQASVTISIPKQPPRSIMWSPLRIKWHGYPFQQVGPQFPQIALGAIFNSQVYKLRIVSLISSFWLPSADSTMSRRTPAVPVSVTSCTGSGLTRGAYTRSSPWTWSGEQERAFQWEVLRGALWCLCIASLRGSTSSVIPRAFSRLP